MNHFWSIASLFLIGVRLFVFLNAQAQLLDTKKNIVKQCEKKWFCKSMWIECLFLFLLVKKMKEKGCLRKELCCCFYKIYEKCFTVRFLLENKSIYCNIIDYCISFLAALNFLILYCKPRVGHIKEKKTPTLKICRLCRKTVLCKAAYL